MKTAKSPTIKKAGPTAESFSSVWDALADTPEQAANLRARTKQKAPEGAFLLPARRRSVRQTARDCRPAT